jgi:aromatic-amino-acid transaminase
MNAPHPPSPLATVPMAPADPILGVTEAFVADQHPKKVNLGVGVYTDDNGKIPVLECVRHAESERLKTAPPRGYLPIDGLAAYDKAVQELVFGAQEKNIVTVQALGGTGGLKIGADFLKLIRPEAEVWISDPSWENHKQLFEAAGFTVKSYAYYEPTTRGLDFAGMERALNAIPAGSIVVLHACCHNPTGVDLDKDRWGAVLEIVRSRGLLPFLDFAYQGFADGLEDDAYAARLFARAMSPVFLSSSFSKSFSLYGERVGALSVVTSSPEEAMRVLSQLKRIVRTNYSNPPTHGSQIVATVLGSPQLRSLWDRERGAMRERIKDMRKRLVDKFHARVPDADFSFVLKQRGMFSYSGLSREQVRRLREEYSIYTIDTGRICVAALTSKNVDYVADAIAKVVR